MTKVLAIIAAATMLLGASSSPRNFARPLGSTQAIPLPAVVVLWATWCASCRAELDRLGVLAAAARPLPVVTLAIDPADKARARLIADHRPLASAFADARAPAAVVTSWGGKGATLPLAVALDRHGRPCGMKRGLLGTDQLRQWAASCSR